MEPEPLTNVPKELQQTPDQYAQQIYDKYLAKVGSPMSLYFASKLALLEAQTATVFHNGLRDSDDPNQHKQEILRIGQETQKVYQDMLDFMHTPSDSFDGVLIGSNTEEHLRLLRLYGFTHPDDKTYPQSMVSLAAKKLAEHQNSGMTGTP